MKNMKKKILFIGLFWVAVVASFQLTHKSKNLECLMLENIEAWAYGETDNVDLILANVEALADHGESSGFKAGYTASSSQYYIYGYGFTTIPCCRYNDNQFSGCSAIDICR